MNPMCVKEWNCFYEIIPWPEKITLGQGAFDMNRPIAIIAEDRHSFQAHRLAHAFAYFGMMKGDAPYVIRLVEDAEIASFEGWRITIDSAEITLCASGNAGMSYAVAALMQMLSVATMPGEGHFLALRCGEAESTPRFSWRGVMLDCARHFVSRDAIVKLLHAMAHFRFNVFHWHLTDNEGWRTPSRFCPELAGKGELNDGMYTCEEIEKIRAVAKLLDIRIVPEFDLPGHSRRLVSVLPELGCRGEAADEICVGNSKARALAGRLLDEFMKLFPDSTEIHLGGDETSTGHWEQCPACQAAMKAKGFSDVRHLGHEFMLEMIERVRKTGRRAIVWNDSGIFPTDVIVQLWVEKNRAETLDNGNTVIASNCATCYADRLLPWDIKFEDGMNPASVEDNYMFEPTMGTHEHENQFLGIELCTWTEHLPERRIGAKLMPRLVALSEVACGDPRQKLWSSFELRAARQRDAALEPVTKNEK